MGKRLSLLTMFQISMFAGLSPEEKKNTDLKEINGLGNFCAWIPEMSQLIFNKTCWVNKESKNYKIEKTMLI